MTCICVRVTALTFPVSLLILPWRPGASLAGRLCFRAPGHWKKEPRHFNSPELARGPSEVRQGARVIEFISGPLAQAGLSGSALAEDGCAPSTRTLLAKRIIETAQKGERDANRLVEDGLTYLSELK
jgi:hypothetical protein